MSSWRRAVVQSSAGLSLAILVCAAGLSPAKAAPQPLPALVTGPLSQPAKTQCYTTEVCVRRGRPWGGHRPPCIEWATRTVCEPHVYNNPNKPARSDPKVHVPELVAKPKPWQFQRALVPPSSIGRAPTFMRR
jgi:hypothetical protein